MLRIKIKGNPQPLIVPAGHDTRRTADGKLEIVDSEGQAVKNVATLDPATVSAVVREDGPATSLATKPALPAVPATK
jgi:hypothetical protein